MRSKVWTIVLAALLALPSLAFVAGAQTTAHAAVTKLASPASLVASLPLAPRMTEASAAPASGVAAAPLPIPVAGQTYWFNDTTVAITTYRTMPPGVKLVFQNATVLFQSVNGSTPTLVNFYANGSFVFHGSRVVGDGVDGTLQASSGLDIQDTTFDRVKFSFSKPSGADMQVARATFAGFEGSTLRGLAVTDSLFYNATCAGLGDCAALLLFDGVTLTNDTFVNNDVAVTVAGIGIEIRACTFRFNFVGVAWSGEDGTIIAGNNFADNYEAGVINQAAGATLDASGNWWDGTPGGDGDSAPGGVTTAPAASSPFAVNDRTGELPFALHSLKGGAWTLGASMDGPAIARSAVAISGMSIAANGFRIGSHPNGRLTISGSTITDAAVVLSRGTDSFTSTTFRATTGVKFLGGLYSLQNSPTVSGDTFVNLAFGVVHLPVLLTDTPLAFTISSSTFRNVGAAVEAALAQPTVTSCTVADADLGFLTLLAQSPKYDANRVERTNVSYYSALDQSPAWTNDASYENVNAFLIMGSTTPTMSGLESRYNVVDLNVAGSQVTLASSNLMDNAQLAIIAEDAAISNPVTGQTQQLTGAVTVAATAYVAGGTRGAVTFAPPARASPTTTSAPAPGTPVSILTSGTASYAGATSLAGPVIVRAGAALRIANASLDAARHLVLAQPGAVLDVRDASVTNSLTFAVRTSNARLVNASFQSATYAGATFTGAAPALATEDSFLGSGNAAGLALLDAPAVVSRSWFRGLPGLAAQNTTSPAAAFQVRDGVFTGGGWGLVGYGYPNGTVTGSSFYSSAGVYDALAAPLLPGAQTSAGGDGNQIDARGNWIRGSVSYDKIPGDAKVMVLSQPRLARPTRASFDMEAPVVSTAQPLVLRDTTLDRDGGVVSRAWSFGDGTFLNTTDTRVAHLYAAPGTYPIVLNVTDSIRQWSLAYGNVTVKAAPVALPAVPAQADSLVEVALDGSASYDPDGAVVAWRWQADDGFDTGFVGSPNATHIFHASGPTNVTLTVRDADGFDSVPVASAVDVANRAPVASLVAPAQTTRVAPVAFASTSADPDGAIVNATWLFGDGEVGYGPNVTHRYAQLGAYGVTLTVTDNLGATAQAFASVEVVNVAPVAGIASDVAVAAPGAPVTFTSASRDLEGDDLAYAWDFGDGATSTAPVVTHVFAAEGTYKVALVVTDADGATDSATVSFVVRYVPNFAVAPESNATTHASPGDDVTIVALVTNRADFTDTFTFGLTQSQAWGGAPPADLAIAPGETARVAIHLRAPPSGTVDFASLRVASVRDLPGARTATWKLDVPVTLVVRADLATLMPWQRPTGHVRATFLNGAAASNVLVALTQTPQPDLHPALASSLSGRTDANGLWFYDFALDAAARLPGLHALWAHGARPGVTESTAESQYVVVG